jgi:monosaccharide-transporting ATPase
MLVTIPLSAQQWAGGAQSIVHTPEFALSALPTTTGVRLLRIEGDLGRIDLLPFQGHQIWDAVLGGRRLTMRSVFDEPQPVDSYLDNAGAYFVHCGGSAMGNPSEDDDHPLHGELPNARMDRAWVELSDGADGPQVSVHAERTFRRAFGPYFAFAARHTLGAGSGLIDTEFALTNLRDEPSPLMYLAHLNFAAAIGGGVEARWREGERPRTRAACEVGRNGSLRSADAAELDRIDVDALHADPADRVVPELVQTLPIARDPDGWVRAAQRHADGSSDIVEHSGADLTHTIRWLRRTAVDDAHGFALPATGEPDGFLAEDAKGHVRRYPQGGVLRGRIRHGFAPAGESGSADVGGRDPLA